MVGMANWDDLPEGLFMQIAAWIHTYADFESTRAVSRHWRSSLKGLHYSSTTPQAPWLMLAEDKDADNNEVEARGFYSLSEDRVRRVKLPERIRRKRCLSSRGWLLTVSHYRSISLLNPFSRRVIHLPDINEAPMSPDNHGDWRFCVDKFVLTSSPIEDEKDYTVMISFGAMRALAVWRPGDSKWTKLGINRVSDVIYSEGIFYFIDFFYKVRACILESYWDEMLCMRRYHTRVEYLADLTEHLTSSKCSKNYLVRSQDKLIGLSRGPSLEMFCLAELTLGTKKVVPISDLGNRSLFLGSNESLSLEVSDGCKPNCIYFTDDYYEYWCHSFGGRSMGIYNLGGGSFEAHYNGESLSRITPPLWVECRS